MCLCYSFCRHTLLRSTLQPFLLIKSNKLQTLSWDESVSEKTFQTNVVHIWSRSPHQKKSKNFSLSPIRMLVNLNMQICTYKSARRTIELAGRSHLCVCKSSQTHADGRTETRSRVLIKLSCRKISLLSRAYFYFDAADGKGEQLSRAACGIIINELLLRAPGDKSMQIIVITEGIIQNARKLALWRLLRECAQRNSLCSCTHAYIWIIVMTVIVIFSSVRKHRNLNVNVPNWCMTRWHEWSSTLKMAFTSVWSLSKATKNGK